MTNLKNHCQCLLAELEKNLELFYVMDQQHEYKLFSLDEYDALVMEIPVQVFPALIDYSEAVYRYNTLYADYQDFQKWYGQDIRRRTRENAVILEEKRERVVANFKELKGLIVTAQEELSQFIENDPDPDSQGMSCGLSASQWPYFRIWITLTVIAEVLMLVWNRHLVGIYLFIAALFGAAFILRVLKIYPGQDEPLFCDASAVVLSIAYAALAGVCGASAWRFLLILCSDGILLPHLMYIYQEK